MFGLCRPAAAASTEPASTGTLVVLPPSRYSYIRYDQENLPACSAITHSYDLGTTVLPIVNDFSYSYYFDGHGVLTTLDNFSVVTISDDVRDRRRGSNERLEHT